MSNPFSPAQLWALADQFGTPLWVYDAATIRQRIAQVSNCLLYTSDAADE